MIYLPRMKLSQDSVSLENTASLAFPVHPAQRPPSINRTVRTLLRDLPAGSPDRQGLPHHRPSRRHLASTWPLSPPRQTWHAAVIQWRTDILKLDLVPVLESFQDIHFFKKR